MSKRPLHLNIGTLAVGSQQPVGLGSLQSSVQQHLHRALANDASQAAPKDVNIPEIRVRAHPSMSMDALGEHVAAEIQRQISEVE